LTEWKLVVVWQIVSLIWLTEVTWWFWDFRGVGFRWPSRWRPASMPPSM
jgi:hypothetical protein